MTTITKDVSMEIAEHQTTVLVRLAGRAQTVIFVFHCLDVSTDLATMPLNATAMKDGREPTVTFPAVATALMDTAFHPMSVSATTDGKAPTVMFAREGRAVFMDLAELIPTLVSARKAGKDIFVIKLLATWDVTMDSAMPRALMVSPTFVSANLDGGEITVIYAVPSGDAPTKLAMLVACQMNVSVLKEKLITRDFATTPFLFIT